MKKTILEKIHIHHFAGIEDEIIEFNPTENWRELQNGKGKTTVADAFNWVICGKDSLGNTRFNFEPTNIENSQTKVTLWLDVDGEKITLQKEVGKWNYNNLEVTKTVFEEFLSNIYNIETLELLSNPLSFMTLHWEKRRNYLTGLFCEKADEKSEFAWLMKSMSISDIRKSKTKQKKVADDALKECKITIKVHEKSIKEVFDIDFLGLKLELKEKMSQLEELSNFDWENYYGKESFITTEKHQYNRLVLDYKSKDSERETIEKEKPGKCKVCDSDSDPVKFERLKLKRLEKCNAELTKLKSEILEKRKSNASLSEKFEELQKTKPDETTTAIIAELKNGIKLLDIQIAKENDIVVLNKKIEAEQKLLDGFVDEIMQIEAFQDRFKDFLSSYYTSINENFEGLFFDIENECLLTNASGTEYKRFSLSEKINAGVQIVSVLSKKIGLSFPMFVDNRESVTELFPIDTQVINLKVKES